MSEEQVRVALKRRARRRQAAEYLCVSVRQLDKLVKDRKIPCARIGRTVVIDLDDLDRYVDSLKQPAA